MFPIPGYTHSIAVQVTNNGIVIITLLAHPQYPETYTLILEWQVSITEHRRILGTVVSYYLHWFPVMLFLSMM